MHDDRVGGFVGPHRAAGSAHLQAIAGVVERLLVGHFGQTERLHADTQTRRVHHHENRIEATVRSEEHTSELQALMRRWYAVFGAKKKKKLSIKHILTTMI